MSELELLQKEAANAANEHTGETGPECAKSNEWFGFYYGYIYAKQEKQANGVNTSTEPALHKHFVNRWAYLFDNWQPIILGIAIALAFNVIVTMFENVIIKIALITHGG
jgi:hypothetical protein